MTQLAHRPHVGRDDDGTWYIIRADGAVASYWGDAWHPGIPWDGRTLCDYRAVEDPAQIERCLAEAADALTESLKD